ncbi:MBL fold metallo-hydrolase [Pseudonocardiaceae bacterium YIM PH 21723]|nr:MBL fold metallo-hydrolase [Pseudonocardiaceae bacterium YIM PH 21723]
MAINARVIELGQGIWAYEQPPGDWFKNNTGWIAGPDRTVLVDTCATERRTRAMLDAVRETVDPAVPVDLVLTHHHGDHVNGAGLVAREGGTVWAAPAALPVIAAGPHLLPQAFRFDGWGDVAPPAGIRGTTLERLDVGGRQVRVMQASGTAHTVGDLIVWLPDSGTLFTGDLVFDGVTPLAAQGSVIGWRKALDWLAALNPKRLVPGHGPVSTSDATAPISALAEYFDWILDVSGVDSPDFAALHEQATKRWPDWLDAERHAVNLRMAHAEQHGRELSIAEVMGVMLQCCGGPITLDL